MYVFVTFYHFGNSCIIIILFPAVQHHLSVLKFVFSWQQALCPEALCFQVVHTYSVSMFIHP